MLIFIVALLSFPSAYAADDTDIDLKIIKFSPADRKAVVQIPGKELLVIKAGDKLEGIGAVVEILGNTVRIEAKTESGVELIIISLDGKKQRVQRIRTSPPPMPMHQTVNSSPVEMPRESALETTSGPGSVTVRQ